MTTNVSPPQRRKFLFTMLGGLGALIGAASAWPVFRFLSPIETDGSGDKVIVARGDVVGGKAHFFQYQGKPAVVLQPAPGEFVALSAVCTHLGCVVAWQEQANEFLCPCHGGRFSAVGQVLAGPPPSPLETLAVELDGDQLKIG
jgi:cytochrome b6-f complex iron-sulfur subunit